MAYVTPDSTVYILSGVECDKNYDHVKWFNSKSEQYNYMIDHRIKSYDHVTYVRDGVFMADAWADDLYSANYIMFRNTAFNDRWFYAFIDSIRWENNRTAEIHYTMDLWQCWWMDCKVGECFVEREHVLDDTIGINTIPEGIEYGMLEVSDEETLTDFTKDIVYGIEIVISEEQLSGIENQPKWYGGKVLGRVFQGAKIGTTTDAESLLDFCQNIITAGYTNTIQQIFTIPKDLAPVSEEGFFARSPELPTIPVRFHGYRPHNNKLYCAPYSQYLVYSPTGDKMVLDPEKFKDRSNRRLSIYGNTGVMPQVTVSPRDYNGVDGRDNTQGFTLNYGVKGSFMYDAYQAELASYGTLTGLEGEPSGLWGGINKYVLPSLQSAGNAVSGGISGAVSGSATGGIAGGGIGVLGGIAGGFSSIVGAVGQWSKDSHDTSRLNGNSAGNILWSRHLQEIKVQVKQIREEYARTVDQFFDMYGYKVNRVKRPQMEGRPAWNYIKCSNVALTGKVPADAQELIKCVIEHGVTFWKTTFHNYSADNSI